MNKFDLISRNLEEVLTAEELKSLIENKEKLVHYIGFEISGLVHLGSGLMTGMKIADFQKASVNCQIFLADWHTWINDKLGGNFADIKRIAVGYFKEAMKVAVEVSGGNAQKVEFILGSQLYHQADAYWLTVIDVAKKTTLARASRSIEVLGRQMEQGIDLAKLIYPVMQVADIFYLGVNLAHAGLDQRKAHVIAKDVATQLISRPLLNKKKEKIKPIALHHHLLLGLQKPPFWPIPPERWREVKIEMKMSKSKPETCVFIHDSPADIERKILKAFCPPKETNYNPVVDWAVNLILPLTGAIKIKSQNGWRVYKNSQALINDYQKEFTHPLDLKEAVSQVLQAVLKPIHSHFQSGRPKKLLSELRQLKR